MKKRVVSESGMFNSRVFVAFSLCAVGAVLAFSTLYGGNRLRPQAGNGGLQLQTSVPTPFSGTYDPHVYPCATPRHHFMVPGGQVRIVVQASSVVSTNDLTVTLLYGPDPNPIFIQTEDTLTSTEVLTYTPAGGIAPGEYQVQICQTPNTNGVPQMAPFDYNGTFTYDNTGGSGGTPATFGTIPPANPDNGPKIGFENFAAPGALVQVKTTEAGQQVNSVEYMGRNAGEPSIGNNWLSDTTIFYSGLETLFVKFNDTCPLNGLSSVWANRAAPTQIAVDSDPIGFTDSPLGRSFTGELTLLTPTCKTSFTDDDGQTWVPTQGSGIASGVDHETIGGGRYHAPLDLNPPSPAYPHAVYYCSQEGLPNSGPPAFCSRSDDGGLTFGPSVPLTTPPVNVCGGLHGHVKVSPLDGTVYVPFNTCGGVGSVIVSEDNGTTWTIRHVQTDTIQMQPSASFQDPALSIDAAGRVYYLIANNDTAAAVLTSDDHGATWHNLGNVGAVYGLQNIRYPAATAGDAGRAAVAFLGTTTPGDALQPTFNGIWHLYVASTFDGGQTWSTTDLTPNAPMQRGCIWAKGGANICRNLLDFFDMTVDKDGRVVVGYVNGCEGATCVQAPITGQGQTPANQGNAYTSAATIARQSSGRRLFAAKDPAVPTAKPGIPSLTARRVGNVVTLQWSEADTGNLMINSYQVWRGTAPGAESFLTSVSGNQVGGSYTDVLPASDIQTYYYKVFAVSTGGTSCGNNEASAPYLGNTCTGLVIHRNEPGHPEANQANGATPPSLLIDYVAVAEPPGTSNLLFKMKVRDLSTVPPNSRWRMVWDSFAAQTVANDAAAQQFYVGMTTGNLVDSSHPPVFEYGTLADAGVPAVFVIAETQRGTPDPSSNYQSDGTITIVVPKSAFGNPPAGTLLGGVNGRTLTGDNSDCAVDINPCTPNNRVERSNAFADHTFVKAQTDNSYPASTYLITGGTSCLSSGIPVVGAVSRMTHGNGQDFDVDLPLSGTTGIEPRRYFGTNAGRYKIVVTFQVPVQLNGPVKATLAAPKGGSVDNVSINNSVVTVDLKDVQDAQTVILTLKSVSDGTNTADVNIPMGVLLGDVDGSRRVDGNDVSAVQSHTRQTANGSNYRNDVNVSGRIDGNDVSTTQSNTRHGL